MLLDSGQYFPVRERCRECRKRTADRKPFCLDHLDELPYVRELRHQLVARSVPGNEMLVSEILARVESRFYTIEKLHLIFFDEPAFQQTLKLLKEDGRLQVMTLGLRRGGNVDVVRRAT